MACLHFSWIAFDVNMVAASLPIACYTCISILEALLHMRFSSTRTRIQLSFHLLPLVNKNRNCLGSSKATSNLSLKSKLC